MGKGSVMDTIIKDGVEMAFEPSYIDTNNKTICVTDVLVTYAGQTITLDVGSKAPESLLDCLYVVVLREKAHKTHYRLVSVKDDKLLYSAEELPWCSLKEALAWKNRFHNSWQLQKVREDYAFFKVMQYSDMTLDWIRSYMPSKRAKIDQATREAVYAKCHGHCAYCGKEISIGEMQVDHVDSHYRHQGKDEIDNYLPSCRDCNGLKSDYDLEEFRNVLIPNCAKKGKICGDNRKSRIVKAYGLALNKKKKIVFYFEKEENK